MSGPQRDAYAGLAPRLLGLLCTAALLACLAPSTAAAGQQPPSTSVLLAPPALAPRADETFRTDLNVQSAVNLYGFQVDLVFDPTYLTVEAVELGPFFASSGRQALPLGPDLRQAAAGRVTVGGYTLGGPEQPAASGDGVLATITWRAQRPGESRVRLEALRLAGADGKALAATTDAGIQIAVSRRERPLGLLLAGAAALALATGLLWRRSRQRGDLS